MSVLLRSLSPDPYVESSGNRLLGAIDREELAGLLEHSKCMNLVRNAVLYQPGDAMRHVWFPVSGVVSVTIAMRDGSTVDVAGVGREGMIGVPALLGYRTSPLRCAVQFPGVGWELPAVALVRTFQTGGSLQRILRRYLHARFQQVCQMAACNLLHSVKQRLALWLLNTRDQVGMEEFPITHEFLSGTLGTQRSTVTLAARALETADLIRYKRGKVTIVNRQGLERSACECYAMIKRHMETVVQSG